MNALPSRITSLRRFQARGFTLVEAIIVMTIIGVVSAMVVLFIRKPIETYLDIARRASLTDEADGAQRLIARELHAALPNSIACTIPAAGSATLSFINIASGGRYREYAAENGTAINNTPLAFGQSTSQFGIIGAGSVTTRDAYGQAVTNKNVVVGNLGAGVVNCNASSPSPANAKSATVSGQSVTFAASTFPTECDLQQATIADDATTPARNEENERSFGRFYMTDPAATVYACGPTGLTRNGAQLASHVNACAIACNGGNARVQTVSLAFTLSAAGEAIQLLRQVHVENLP